jgi:hypothetical protein
VPRPCRRPTMHGLASIMSGGIRRAGSGPCMSCCSRRPTALTGHAESFGLDNIPDQHDAHAAALQQAMDPGRVREVLTESAPPLDAAEPNEPSARGTP